jgi:hypothetical protein
VVKYAEIASGLDIQVLMRQNSLLFGQPPHVKVGWSYGNGYLGS